jgi:hypothetical protein
MLSDVAAFHNFPARFLGQLSSAAFAKFPNLVLTCSEHDHTKKYFWDNVTVLYQRVALTVE